VDEFAADARPYPLPQHLLAEPVRDPDDGERIIAPDPRVVVLPDPAEVFVDDQPWLVRLLHPLVSVELTAFDPAWSGRVHLLSPVEPEEGLLGEDTSAHHDDFACENWISFHVENDGRYRFLGQRRFFEIEDMEASGEQEDPSALYETYAAADAEFTGTKARWERLGALVWGDAQDPTRQRESWGTDIALVDEIGGEPGYGNWHEFPPPKAFALDSSDPAAPVLRLADGRPFTYIGGTAGYPWRNQGADQILLFFEPETRTAALTFDWS